LVLTLTCNAISWRNLVDKLDTMELVMLEIMANTRAMQAMLEELKETADAQ
jgi:hypothetical protein